MSNYDRPIDALLNELPQTLKSQANLTRRATMGIKQLYAEIRSSAMFPAKRHHHLSFSSTDGGLSALPAELPVMVARYKCTEHIADGTFSQILMAVDLHTNASGGGIPVAIKMLHKPCAILGFRELTMLYHLQSACRHTASPFVAVSDAFSFQDHVALVMEYFPYTLIDLFQQPRAAWTDVPAALLKQPRAIRQEHIAAPPRTRPTTSIPALRRLAAALAKTLWLLQEKGIIHADIKPENIFLRPAGDDTAIVTTASLHTGGNTSAAVEELLLQGEIKLGDFGNALHVSEVADYYTDFEIQSLPYRAPEVLMRHPFDGAIDMWSLGVLLVEVYLQEPLFTVTSKQQLHAAIEQKLGPIVIHASTSKPPFSETDLPGSWRRNTTPLSGSSAHMQAIQRLLVGAPSDFITFIAGVLQADPAKRLTPLSALRHPFLSGTSDVTFAPILKPASTAECEIYTPSHTYAEESHSAEVKIEEASRFSGSGRTVSYHSALETQVQTTTPVVQPQSRKLRETADPLASIRSETTAVENRRRPPQQPATTTPTQMNASVKREHEVLLLDSSSESEIEPASQRSERSQHSRLRRYEGGSSAGRPARPHKPDEEHEADDPSQETVDDAKPASRRRRTDGTLPMFAQLSSPTQKTPSRRRSNSSSGRNS